MNSKGQVIPTYDQDVITGFAHVFTGWDWNQFDPAAPPAILPANFAPSSNYVLPMTEIPAHHFTGQKRLLNNVVLPGLPTLPSLANAVLDPYATHTTAQIQTPGWQGNAQDRRPKNGDAATSACGGRFPRNPAYQPLTVKKTGLCKPRFFKVCR